MSAAQKIIGRLRDFALPLVMLTGIVSYFVFTGLHLSPEVRLAAAKTVGIVQPALISCMFFISFCKIDPRHIGFFGWHKWLILIQTGSFIIMALLLRYLPGPNAQLLMQCAMACMICPTATAAVVITDKLGGRMPSIVSYTILINLVVSFVIALFIPVFQSTSHTTFFSAFSAILIRVFTTLVFPFFAACAVRLLLPKLLYYILYFKDLAFYIWLVALTLALAVTTRALVHAQVSFTYLALIAVISAVCCVLQFAIGKRIGTAYNDRISGGQAMGQKNTVFIIWIAYTFMNPVVAVSGGFYSIWHNLINAWQLYRKRIASEAAVQQGKKETVDGN